VLSSASRGPYNRYTYLAIIYTSFMSALLGRHARVAVIVEKEATIEAKKAFVRYIR